MMLDTQPKMKAIAISEPPIPTPEKPSGAGPRIRFRDYRCTHCGRLLMRASLDNVALALPADFAKTHPLAYTALKSIVVECRCPKCGLTNSFAPLRGE